MEKKLTILQAYDVMTDFIEKYWKKTGCDEIACLLSDMSKDVWADGSTGDPAIWGEWEESVQRVVGSLQELTIKEAYESMVRFLGQYIPFQESEGEASKLLNGIKMGDDGSIADPVLWQEWLKSVNYILGGKGKSNNDM